MTSSMLAGSQAAHPLAVVMGVAVEVAMMVASQDCKEGYVDYKASNRQNEHHCTARKYQQIIYSEAIMSYSVADMSGHPQMYNS